MMKRMLMFAFAVWTKITAFPGSHVTSDADRSDG